MPNALVRPPAPSYAVAALSRDSLPSPVDLALALQQHAAYAAALETAGVEVTVLPPEERLPDSTFMQDPAFVVGDLLIVGNLAADSREGEEEAIVELFAGMPYARHRIAPPAILEGGDILLTEDRIYVGMSSRTGVEAVRQLRPWTSRPIVPVPVPPEYLHLLTGCSYLGGGRLLATAAIAALPEMRAFETLIVPAEEERASNTLAIGENVLVAAGYPRTGELLDRAGFQLFPVPISEFEKRDGSITCLSLIF